jgi:hypothetical protein
MTGSAIAFPNPTRDRTVRDRQYPCPHYIVLEAMPGLGCAYACLVRMERAIALIDSSAMRSPQLNRSAIALLLRLSLQDRRSHLHGVYCLGSSVGGVDRLSIGVEHFG